MLLGINLLLLGKVNAARHKLTTTVETTVRRDLQLEDVKGIDCLPNADIFEQLTLMGAKTTAWNEFSSTMASAIICLATNQKFNFSKYIFESMVKNLDDAGKFLMYPRFVQVFLDNQLEGMATHNMTYIAPSYTKKIFANMRRQGKDFSGKVTPLFPTMMVQVQEEMGEDEDVNEEPSMQLKELIDFYTKLQQRVLDLENTKTAQAQEIKILKMRVKKLEKQGGSRTHKLKRLYKVGRSARVVSSEEAEYGDHEDATKIGEENCDMMLIIADPVTTAGEVVTAAEVRLAREKDEANVALIEEWNDIQVKDDVGLSTDPKTIQASRTTRLSIKEKSKLFYNSRSKKEILAMESPKDLRTIPFYNSSRIFDQSHKKRINTIIYIDTDWVKYSQEQEKEKNQKVDEDKEIVELQSLMEVIPDEEEVAFDAIPLATKSPSIVDYKIIKEGKISYYQIIRADRSSKRYLAFIQILRSFDREDLETLWKLVKAKHGYTRPEEGYERVL
ncbi:hypothetical protein Tco_1110005 [Tanacetum coccineum]|uniref:Uncharacterized protein n=1 Tax=Tanacetum coccineum TaxID=301880 RepID=A0ABQ5IHL0_9ASTR